MPRVPTVDGPMTTPGGGYPTDFGARVAMPLPTASGVAGRQAVEMGQAMMQSGRQFGAIALDMQREVDEAQAKEFDNQFAEALRATLHDPEGGYLNAIGKDAVFGRQKAVEAIQATRKQIEDGITMPGQKSLWGPVADRRMQAALMQIDDHAARQIKVYNEGQTVARVKSAGADMQANWAGWKDPQGRYTEAKKTAEGEFAALAKLRGYSPEQQAQGLSETMAGFHVDIVRQMVSLGQNAQAKDYLAVHGQEIQRGAPDKMDDINKLLSTAGVKADSLTLSMQLKGGFNDKLKTLDAMFAKGEITAEVHDAAKERVTQDWHIRKSQQAEGEKALVGSAFDWVLKNPGKTVLDMPPAMYAGLKNTGHLAQLASFARVEGKPEGDPAVYYRLRQQAGQDPLNFSRADLMAERDKLSPQQWDHLVELQAGILKNDLKLMASEKIKQDTVQALSAEIAAAGIDMKADPKHKSAAEKTAAFSASLVSAMDDEERRLGRALNLEEGKAVARAMLKTVVTSEGWFDTKAPAWKAMGYQYQDIPDKSRSEIIKQFHEKYGRAPTQPEVVRNWQQAVRPQAGML